MTKSAKITLVRGRNYSVIHPTDRRKGSFTFTRGNARIVEDEAIITVCEELHEVIIDSDEEEVEKPIFKVERGNFKDTDAPAATARKRLSAGQTRAPRRATRKL